MNKINKQTQPSPTILRQGFVRHGLWRACFLTVVGLVTLSAGSLSFGMNIWDELSHINNASEPEKLKNIKELVKQHDGLNIINSKNESSETPLHLVSPCGDYIRKCDAGIEIFKYLLQNSTIETINSIDIYDSTPLSLACYSGFIEKVSLLLQNNANINKETLLHTRDQGIIKLIKLVEQFDTSTNKIEFINEHKNNPEIYDCLNKRWLNSLKGKNTFLTKHGKATVTKGLSRIVKPSEGEEIPKRPFWSKQKGGLKLHETPKILETPEEQE